MVESSEKHIYSGKRSKTSAFGALIIFVRDSHHYRDLIIQLYKRDFLFMYKKSFLGFGWHIMAPIIGMISWVFLNLMGVMSPGEMTVPYPVYVLFGTTFWGMFNGVFLAGQKVLESGKGFITQVSYPHYVMFSKEVLQAVSSFGLGFVFNVFIVLIFGVQIRIWVVPFLPLFIVPVIFLAGGMGLVSSIFTSAVPDLGKISNTLIGLLFFTVPAVFREPKFEGIKNIVEYNPLTHLVFAPRDLLLGMRINWELYILFALGSFLFFILAFKFFYLFEERLVERLV